MTPPAQPATRVTALVNNAVGLYGSKHYFIFVLAFGARCAQSFMRHPDVGDPWRGQRQGVGMPMMAKTEARRRGEDRGEAQGCRPVAWLQCSQGLPGRVNKIMVGSMIVVSCYD